MKQPTVYILTNFYNTVLYIGVTSDLPRRIYQHKEKFVEGFTKKYNLTKLVYFEQFDDIQTAILREKKLKKWRRKWKDNLINDLNPDWDDLYAKIIS